MSWKNLSYWLKGAIIGAVATLLLSLINHYILKISWSNSPLGLINLAICGFNKCGITITILNWVILPIIFLIIWMIIGKIKSKKQQSQKQ